MGHKDISDMPIQETVAVILLFYRLLSIKLKIVTQ
jgi:hypothetical protein